MKQFYKRALWTLIILSITCGTAPAQDSWMPDVNLRLAVREALGFRSDEPFTRDDLLQLHRLDLWKLGVEDLTGLEHAKNMTWFSFAENHVSDLTPLTGLTQLQTLYGWSNKHLSDISPLANLALLRTLNIPGGEISDITPLENLSQLERLNLSYNRIENIETLANLTELKELRLKRNQIVDVRPLANLTGLEVLHIDNNWITNLSLLDGLNLTEFVYDEVCLIAASPVKDRIAHRTYPSFFKTWSDITNLPELSWQARTARHDLYVAATFQLHFLQTENGVQFVGDLQASKHARYALSRLNPNMIIFAEIRCRDDWPSQYPEDWQHWIRDEHGNRVPAGSYPAFLIDFTHPDMQDIIVEHAAAARKCGLYDGIFFDWWREDGPVLEGYRRHAAEQRARDAIIQRVRQAVGEDFLILVNPNRTQPRRAAPYINGLFIETVRDNADGYTYAGLKQIEETLLWAENNLRQPRINALEGWSPIVASDQTFEGPPVDNKGVRTTRVVYIKPEHPDNLRWMRAFTTLSLTHSDGYVKFNTHHYQSLEVDQNSYWYDFWDAELGQPVGPKAETYRNIDGLFIREFDDGFAVYNRSGSEQMIHLPEEVSGFASGIKNNRSHTIEDLDGEIYLKTGTVENPADLNSDGTVNILDLVIVANALGEDTPDLNGDGIVNILDLVSVANAFGDK